MTVRGRELSFQRPKTAVKLTGEPSFVMHGGRRKPLGSIKLSGVSRSKRSKKPVHFPVDDIEFYTNIWTAPPTTAEREAKSVRKYIDITQVAYVLTTVDYKGGYEGAVPEHDGLNLWTAELEPVSVAASEENGKAAKSQKVRHFSQLLNIVESGNSSDGEDNPAAVAGPPLSAKQQLAQIKSAPVSGPLRNGDNIVFSTVLARGGDIDTSWNSKFLLGLHEPIRHALYVIDRFLERSQKKATPMEWNVSEFFTWFKSYFMEFLKCQHEVKMKVLLPLIYIKYTVKCEIIEYYDAIFMLLETIILQEDQLLYSAAINFWQDNLMSLQNDIRKLNMLLYNVLTMEEMAMMPSLGEAFTETSFKRFVMPRVFRSCKPRKVVIPWIVERCRVWGGDKEAQAFKDELPFTARFLYDRVWHPFFVSHVASAMKNLDIGMTGMMGPADNDSWCVIQ